MNKEEKIKKLENTVFEIEKEFGKGAIIKLGNRAINKTPNISTGSLALNKALGIGGYPKGRIIEIYGPESSGKTTLTLHAIAEAQKAGGIAAFIDAEHALDPVYAKSIGVDVDELWISQPDTGEQALEIVDTLLTSGSVDLIIIDSVAALTPRAEIEGDMGDSHMGLQARLMSQALRKLTTVVSKSNTTVIFINQLRMKIGVMFGNPETTPGGNALKFYSSIRLDIRKIETVIDSDKEASANRVRVKVVKNKLAPPFRQCEFEIEFGKGINPYSELVIVATQYNVIQKAGSWYSFGEQRLGQGKENVVKLLKDNNDLYLQIKGLTEAQMFPKIEDLDVNTEKKEKKDKK